MSLNSKARSQSDRKSLSTTTTPTKSAVKELPGKVAKEVKHQFRRLDGVLHHVIHPRHHGVQTHPFSVTSPSSPIFYPIDVVRAFLSPDESSATRSVHSRDVKYGKEADSIDETPADLSIDLSMSVGNSSTTHSDRSDEHHLPQEEPQLNLHEQDTSTFDPTVTSPNEPETPDPILVDDKEEYSLSKEEAYEKKASSDANTHRTEASSEVVLPSHPVSLDIPSIPDRRTEASSEVVLPVSLDLPSTPDACISQTEVTSDAQQVVLPSHPVSLDIPSIPDRRTEAASEVVLPSPPVSLDLPSTPDASISQTEVASDAQQVVLPSHPVSLDIPSIPDSSILQIEASSEVVMPSQPVSLDLPSTPPDATISETEVASDDQPVVLPSHPVSLEIPSIPDSSILQKVASDDQQVVLPSHPVSLDIPSIPDSSIPQTQASSNPQQVVLPSQVVPLDIPSTPDASIPQNEVASDAQQVVLPSQHVPLDIPSSVPQTQASSDANPQKAILPSPAVLLDLPSSSVAQPSGAKPQHVVLPSQAVPLDVPSDIAQPQASSDAKLQQAVSPLQVVPLDLPSPEASIPQPLPKLQSNTVPLPANEVPDLDVPALAVPSMFLPIPNVRRSFSSNLLTWWLPFSPLPLLPPLTRYFASIPRILTDRRMLFLVLLLLIRDSTAPLAAHEALALFATF